MHGDVGQHKGFQSSVLKYFYINSCASTHFQIERVCCITEIALDNAVNTVNTKQSVYPFDGFQWWEVFLRLVFNYTIF